MISERRKSMKSLWNRIYAKYRLSTGISVLIGLTSFIISLLLFFLAKNVASGLLTQHLEKYMTYIHNEFDTSITDLSSQLHMYTLPLSLDSSLVLSLNDKTKTKAEQMERIGQLITSNVLDMDFIEKAAIISHTGEAFCFSHDGSSFSALPPDFIKGTNGYNIFLHDTPVTVNGQSYIVFGKILSNYYSGLELGYIECYINENTIFSMFENSTLQNSETFLACNGNIISHKDKNQLGKELYIPGYIFSEDATLNELNSGKFVSKYSTTSFSGSNFDMISIVDSHNYYETLKNFNTIIVYIFGLNLVIAFLIAYLLSKNLTNSISALNKKISLYPEKIVLEPTGNNELFSLEKRFLDFENQIDDLMQKNDMEKKKQKVAELAALQAQINPHFVYNALDSMSWIAKINHQEQIERICSALASYFRLGLHNGDNKIMIKDEIRHVKSYITVEQIRFPNAFDVFFDIDESIEDFMTLKIIIQPIVENCIKHAFNQIPHKGIIEISGYPEEDDIVFRITDNGSGMAFDPLTTTTQSDFKVGYGVKNVQNRLELEYGKGYGLSYSSVPMQGTTVTIRIKKQQ